MTVLPFRERPVTTDRPVTPTPATAPGPGPGPAGTSVELVGTFPAPSGGRGTFAGTYRLERLLNQFEQLAASGVFTGELRDADGTHVGICSRRITCAAVVDTDSVEHELRIGPVDVNLLGFMVTVDEFSVALSRELRGVPSPTRGLLGELPYDHRPDH